MKGILDDGFREPFREPLIEAPSEQDYISLHATDPNPYLEDEDEGSVVSDIVTDDIGTAYDDFQTVDWLRDQANDRARHKHTMTQGFLYKGLDAASGWMVVFIIGVLSGLVAGVVEIGAKWLIDVREGYCGDGWFLDKEACCWSNSTIIAQDYCSNWLRWSELMVGGDNKLIRYAVNYFCYICIGTSFAMLTVIFVMVIAPYASGSGIPEVKTILSGFIIRGYLGLSTLMTKSVGLVLCVASGLSLGKEGPMVHVACCIGNVFVRLFPKFTKNEARKREVLSAAAAAGVSVAFGAPLGGVLFSLEEVSYYFPHKTLWRSFFCAMVASVVLQSLNPYSTGQSALFYIEYDYAWHFFELIPFVILGCIGGVLGALFIKCNIYWCIKRKTSRLGHHPFIEVAAVALVTGIISFVNPFTRKSTSGLIKELFAVCEWEDNSDLCDYKNTERITNNGTTQASNIAWGAPNAGLKTAIWELMMAAIVKSVITVFTFGLKVPAGLFIPSLAVGGCIGRVVGELVQYITYLNRDSSFLQSICPDMSVCTLTGLYAMVGAAAVLSGVTRMTVSLVVIMFELTGGITYIVPIMVAVMTAKWVGDFITPNGIYDAHITINGYPYLDGKDRFMHTSVCEDVCKTKKVKDLQMIDAHTVIVQDLEVLLETTTYHGYPIVADTQLNIVIGYVSRNDLIRALKCARDKHIDLVNASRVYFSDGLMRSNAGGGPISVSLGKFVNHDPICIEPKTPLAHTIDMFTKLGLSQVLITHRGKLKGVITRKDVLRHIDYLKTTVNGHHLF